MARHLKTSVISDLTSTVFRPVPSPAVSTRHARGVRYFEPIVAIRFFCGIMNSHKKGQKYRKHIIVRRAPHCKGLHQLYTYHFPKTWSAACVVNRELIKLAQKRAHALEHDHSFVGIEWRIRFFKHYYRVFKGGAAPEPGLKPYSRFYQYTYVAIYSELKAAQQEILDRQASSSSLSAQDIRPALEPSDITIAPLVQRSTRLLHPLSAAHRVFLNPGVPSYSDPPPIGVSVFV